MTLESPFVVDIKIWEIRIAGPNGMILRHHAFGTHGQKLPIHFTATDNPRLIGIGNEPQCLIHAVGDLNALGAKLRITRENDISATFERLVSRKAEQGLSAHDDRSPHGAGNKMSHVLAVGHDHITIEPDTPVIANSNDSLYHSAHLRSPIPQSGCS